MTLPMFTTALDSATAVDCMVSVVGTYTLDALNCSEERQQHKQQCAERLRTHGGKHVPYAEQAILANLDWGIDALEDAFATTNDETRIARLDHAEKMLQVCALLDGRATTAGVQNTYLSAWAHLNLAFVGQLRGNETKVAKHMLEMFLVDPLYARLDFAPGLWEHLFLPHLSNIVNWYTRQRQHIFVSGSLKQRSEETDISFSRDFVPFNEMVSYNSLNLTAEQTIQLQALEKQYQESLDENTRQFARYYKDCMNADRNGKRGMPLMPIAEPPMTPMIEICMPATVGPKAIITAVESSGFTVRHNLSALETLQESTTFRASTSSQDEEVDVDPEDADSPNTDFMKCGQADSIQLGNQERLTNSSRSSGRSLEIKEILPDSEVKFDCKLKATGQLKWTSNCSTSSESSPGSSSGGSCTPRPSQYLETTGEYMGKSSRTPSSGPVLAEDSYSQKCSPCPVSSDEVIKVPEPKSLSRCKSGRYQEPRVAERKLQTSFANGLPNCQLADSSVSLSSAMHAMEPDVLPEDFSDFSDTEDEHTERTREVQFMELNLGGGSIAREVSTVKHIIHDDDDVDSVLAIAMSGPLYSPDSHADSMSTRDHFDYQENLIAMSGELRRSSVTEIVPMGVTKPPKDFVCPITGQLFNDPVTLETGQTYERKAIQDWVDRGNTTCPMTQQTLRSTILPSTNYVLKRLVDGWQEGIPKLAGQLGAPMDYSANVAADYGTSIDYIHAQHVNQDCYGIIDFSQADFGERSPDAFSPCSLSSVSSSGTGSPGPGRVTRRFNRRSSIPTATSPSNIELLICDLKPLLACICTSEDLAECEIVVLDIARIWQESKENPGVLTLVSKAGVIDGLIEVLSNSEQMDVLRATLYLLSCLIAKDDFCRETVIRSDPNVECLSGLLRKGIMSAVVVLHQLRLPVNQLLALNLLPLLVGVIKQSDNKGSLQTEFPMIMKPKAAAVVLLEHMLTRGDQVNLMNSAQVILALQALPSLITSLEARDADERTGAVSLLLCCMQTHGPSRRTIAQTASLGPVVNLLHSGNDKSRTVTISFLADLVRLSRRAVCNEILEVVKSEGLLSSMHVLLTHLQMAPVEQRPIAAGLLLQLDLLTEPLKRSIYREEAVEAFIEALTSKEFVLAQLEAANTLLSLGGRFSHSGRPMMEAYLLKASGLEKSFASFAKAKDLSPTNEVVVAMTDEEEKEAREWEKRVAGALVSYNMRGILEAIGEGFQSQLAGISKPCLIVAAWITYMLPSLPDTGVRVVARKCFLEHFVSVLHTSKDSHMKVLAALAIHEFMTDPEAVQEILLKHAKQVVAPLRQLKKSTWVARDMLKLFIAQASPIVTELWAHGEIGQLDVSAHGEVKALAMSNGRLFSGHSDGSLQVWDARRKRLPTLMQEIRDHTKSITSLVAAPSTDRLYSGSLDKSIRVWAVGPEEVRIVHVFELKDPVQGLVVRGPMACIVPQGNGIKCLKHKVFVRKEEVYIKGERMTQVQYEDAATKLLNPGKHVQSLCISDDKIFCGCSDNSIQELDPLEGSIVCIQPGVRTLLGKKAVYAMQVYKDRLFAAGTSLEGVVGKVWKPSDHSVVGTLYSTAEVRSMAVSDEFVYLGTCTGSIEVWLRERLVKVTTLNACSKVLALLHEGGILYSGSEDGKIRAWAI